MIGTVDVANIVQGDTVRVVLEGKASGISSQSFWVGVPDAPAGHGNAVYPAEQHVISVEKLAKPVAVGDVLTAEQYAAVDWEQGSVVIDDERDVLLLAVDEAGELRWLSSSAGTWWGIGELARFISSVKVLHLPTAEVKDAK